MRTLLLILFFWLTLPTQAQMPAPVDSTASAADSLWQVDLDPVVVTATRSAKELEDVAVPTSVVTASQMRQQGALRLSDVLAEVSGLSLHHDHGTGLQVQGFDPDYTLILIDGEPVVGRTAGTLDLDRLTVSGLERIEIVRGPSSSLYGSEALAGVVNLITQRPREGVRGSVGGRYGTHRSSDLNATMDAGTERLGVRLLLDRYASHGYDLDPDVLGSTAPRFADYTGDVRLRFDASTRTQLRIGARYNRQRQQNAFALQNGGSDPAVPHDQVDARTDWSLHPELSYRFSPHLRAIGSLYLSRFHTTTRMTQRRDGALYYADDFDQRYAKGELQVDAFWDARHHSIAGGGYTREVLHGDRYEVGAPRAHSAFAFAQHEWLPGELLELNVSARFDAHSDYAARISPKASVLMRPLESLRLRASVGSGFKAPDFRQLYLTFTNAAAGYSVYGATEVQAGLQRLEREGQLDATLIPTSSLEAIRAEHSVAYNVGFTVEPADWLDLEANAFYNDVYDLIDTQPVARKTNGSFVYSYFNLSRIYTRGVEAEVRITPLRRVTFTSDYQFLQAHDREAVDAISEGTVFGRLPSGADYRLTLADYGGLFGRSTHTASLKTAVRDPGRRLVLTVRGLWRSRYGYRDIDGNGLPNRDDEFVPGYAVVNATLTKDWSVPGLERLSLQLGADNLTDVRKPSLVPSMPGRTLYAGMNLYFD